VGGGVSACAPRRREKAGWSTYHCMLSAVTQSLHVSAGDGVGAGGTGAGVGIATSRMHGQIAVSYLGSLVGGVIMYETPARLSVRQAPW